MKPEGWECWPEHKKIKHAAEFRLTPRGKFIISQALAIAIEKLMEVEPPEMRETSNIDDMLMLREAIYNYPVLTPEFARSLVESNKSLQAEIVQGQQAIQEMLAGKKSKKKEG